MFKLMKEVILAKKQTVEELSRRVDIFYASGKLTEEEKNELDQMIFDNQTVNAEKDTLEALYRTLVEKYNELAARVAALEGDTGESGSTETDIPAWEPWDGVSTNYQIGAVVTHNGKTWENVLEGMQNVWEPGVVDERYWIERG